jgi:hypothetical protein
MKLPVFGIRGLTLLPKKPNSQSTIKITMIVHNMKILLLKIQPATWLVNWMASFSKIKLIWSFIAQRGRVSPEVKGFSD